MSSNPALTHAEQVLFVLEQDLSLDIDVAHHVLGLRLQVEYAREELFQAEQVARGAAITSRLLPQAKQPILRGWSPRSA